MNGDSRPGVIPAAGIIPLDELAKLVPALSVLSFQEPVIIKRCLQYLTNNHLSFSEMQRMLARDPGELSAWLYPGENQMFRDITFWKYLIDNPGLAFPADSGSSIMFFDCPTGEEYFSWEILRHHFFPGINTKVRITTQLRTSLSLIRRRQMVFKKIGTLPALVQHLEREINVMEYLEQKYNTWYLAYTPEPAPETEICDCITPFPSGSFSTIFCRNRLIYYKEAASMIILSNLFRALIPGGYFIAGTHDNQAIIRLAGFVNMNAELGIYRKPD